MRSATIALLGCLLGLAGPAAAQEGFEADRLLPCLSLPGLTATCRAAPQSSPFVLAVELDWSRHLLGLRGLEPGDESTWLVEQRLSLRLEGSWAPTRRLRLLVGLDGAAYQRGQRIDFRGAPVELGPAIGRSWLGAVWLLAGRGTVADVGLVTRLILPTASAPGLTGPERVEWRLGLLASAQLGWLRGVLNLGIALGQDARFRDMLRDEALTCGAGLELVGPGWPWIGFAELNGLTRLEAPFVHRVDQTLEAWAGIGWRGLNRLDILVAAGGGLLGPSAPGFRILAVLRLRLGTEKRSLEIE